MQAELVTKEQDQLLMNIFELIKAQAGDCCMLATPDEMRTVSLITSPESQDILNVNKEIIEDSDLAKFVDVVDGFLVPSYGEKIKKVDAYQVNEY